MRIETLTKFTIYNKWYKYVRGLIDKQIKLM